MTKAGLFNAFFVLGRSIGLIGHYFDQIRGSSRTSTGTRSTTSSTTSPRRRRRWGRGGNDPSGVSVWDAPAGRRPCRGFSLSGDADPPSMHAPARSGRCPWGRWLARKRRTVPDCRYANSSVPWLPEQVDPCVARQLAGQAKILSTRTYRRSASRFSLQYRGWCGLRPSSSAIQRVSSMTGNANT